MNERIARWAGWTYQMTAKRHPGEPFENPAMRWVDPAGNYAQDEAPAYDTDITCWHGEDGLLRLIFKRGLRGPFSAKLAEQLCLLVAEEDDGTRWIELCDALAILRATPAQLTSALVSVIEEVGE